MPCVGVCGWRCCVVRCVVLLLVWLCCSVTVWFVFVAVCLLVRCWGWCVLLLCVIDGDWLCGVRVSLWLCLCVMCMFMCMFMCV